MGKSAVLYARVSTEEQKENGFSLQDQVARLKKYCAQNDFRVLKVFEEDCSAKTFNRPQFKHFLQLLEEGNIKPNIFLCVRPDRFSRNLDESLKMLKTLRAYGIEVQFIENNIKSDNPEDLLLKVIYLALPEIDNQRRSQNVTRGMRRAKKEGRWMGTPLKGYKMEHINGAKLMTPDDDAKFILEAYKTFSKGVFTMEEVRKQLWKKSFKVSKNQFKLILSNICYTGKIVIGEWKDEPKQIVNGLHEGIISDKLFNQVQDILTGRRTQSKHTKRKEELPLRGFLQCAKCGGKLTGSGSKSRSGEKHFYYHCQKGCKERFRADEANELFMDYLNSFQLPDEIITLYFEVMRDIFKVDDKERLNEIFHYEKQINHLQDRLASVHDKFIDDIIDERTYNHLKKRYENDLSDLVIKQGHLKAQKTHFEKYMLYSFSLISNLKEYYEKASLEVKQKVIGSIFPEKLVFDDKKYRTAKHSQFLSLLCLNFNELNEIKKDSPESNSKKSFLVDPLGLEPRMAGPKPAVLPITPWVNTTFS